MFYIHYREDEDEPADFWERIRYRYSAASAAITFLKSISPQARMQFRKVLIYEDYVSVAFPESHALGLVPYCLENPRLRIERRVNVWRNVLRSGSYVDLWKVVYGLGLHRSIDVNSIDAFWANVSGGFALWIKEALVLTDHDIPPDSFKLVFDGHPAPEQSSQIFEMVKTTAAWRIALDLWYSQNEVKPRWRRTATQIYHFEDFARIVKEIVRGDSFISCNFPVGEFPDLQPFYEESRGWTSDLFEVDREMLGKLVRMRFVTAPLLPSWLDLQLEEVLPDE